VKRRLTTTDITVGWTVRIVRKDGSTFIAHENNPGQRAFFTKHADARAFVKDIRAHHMRGRIVSARLILEAE
jgi:hypothetical protein